MGRGRPRRPLVDRFWEKVNKRGPRQPHMRTRCHLWTGSDAVKYGVIGIGGSKYDYAHRVAWRLADGEIPPGLHVLHHCDVKMCVRKSHLYLGTDKENGADRKARGRVSRHGGTSSGEKNGSAKLTWAIVKKIRASDETNVALGSEYGVSDAAVSSVRRHKTWLEATNQGSRKKSVKKTLKTP